MKMKRDCGVILQFEGEAPLFFELKIAHKNGAKDLMRRIRAVLASSPRKKVSMLAKTHGFRYFGYGLWALPTLAQATHPGEWY